MKYYSEELDQFFDSEKDLRKAEEECLNENSGEYDDECDLKDSVIKELDEKLSNTKSKKELADDVEKSDEALKEARELYDIAEQQVQELSKEYLAKVDDIMKEAKDRLKKAETDRYNAIKAFNDSYGVYRVTYTGTKAAEDLKRTLKEMCNPSFGVFDLFNKWF